MTQFMNAVVRVLPRVKSDHHPILVNFRDDELPNMGNRPFRYQAAWQLHPEFRDFFISHWQANDLLMNSLESFKGEVTRWNREVFGFIERRKKRLLLRLGGIQRALDRSSNPFLWELENQLLKELKDVLRQEEVLWFQTFRSH